MIFLFNHFQVFLLECPISDPSRLCTTLCRWGSWTAFSLSSPQPTSRPPFQLQQPQAPSQALPGEEGYLYLTPQTQVIAVGHFKIEMSKLKEYPIRRLLSYHQKSFDQGQAGWVWPYHLRKAKKPGSNQDQSQIRPVVSISLQVVLVLDPYYKSLCQ